MKLSLISRQRKPWTAWCQRSKSNILKILEGLKKEPWQGKRLHGELEGLLSLRFGLWRIVYEVEHEHKVVIIHGIGPRGDIYKR